MSLYQRETKKGVSITKTLGVDAKVVENQERVEASIGYPIAFYEVLENNLFRPDGYPDTCIYEDDVIYGEGFKGAKEAGEESIKGNKKG